MKKKIGSSGVSVGKIASEAKFYAALATVAFRFGSGIRRFEHTK